MPGNNPDSLVLQSHAKINLFLHVTGKRDDGYHELETVFQFLDYRDLLRFELTGEPGIVRIDDHPYLLPQSDLIIRSAELLTSTLGLKIPAGVKVTLTKVIPPGSGMGGGSSNAATTLLALNSLWNLHLTRPELQSLAKQLGADVPVFIYGHSCWATGIGDEFERFDPEQHWYCICVPEVFASTEVVFRHPDLCRNHPPVSKLEFRQGKVCNDLEAVSRSLYPEIEEALELLNQYGQARMNGSGASVFLQCESEVIARQIRDKMPDHLHCIVARSLNNIRDY